MSNRERLRILSIAHPAVSRDVGRLRYYPLAERADVHLVVPARWRQYGRWTVADSGHDPALTVHVLPIRLPEAGPAKWYLHFYPGLPRVLREVAPDVIHLWEEPWSVVALQAQLLRRTAAVVLEVDQNILKRLPLPFEAIRRYVLRRTDHVLSRSDDATRVVRARGYTGPVTPIAYGVDRRYFYPAAALALRSADRRMRIGYVGRLVEEKGLDDAIEAIRNCAVPTTLTIMGEGPYERSLKQRVQEFGLSNQVTFRSWSAPADVAAFIRSLDVLVLLTRTTRTFREQFGRIIIEAQACGVPVIGSQCGAIPEVVADGGWIIPECDPAGLTLLLDRIAADPQLRHAKSVAALRNVERRFTYQAVADALAAACSGAAADRRSFAALRRE